MVYKEHTLTLRGGAQANRDQLQLIYLVREGLDEVVVDGYPLCCALLLGVVCHEYVRQFVPQLPLPVVFEGEEVVLQVIGRRVSLLSDEVGDLLVVHLGYA